MAIGQNKPTVWFDRRKTNTVKRKKERKLKKKDPYFLPSEMIFFLNEKVDFSKPKL